MSALLITLQIAFLASCKRQADAELHEVRQSVAAPQRVLDEVSSYGSSVVLLEVSTGKLRDGAQEHGLIFNRAIDIAQQKFVRDVLVNELTLALGTSALSLVDSTPGVVVQVDQSGLEFIQSSPYIGAIYPVFGMTPHLDGTIPYIEAEQGWQTLNGQGSGVNIAVIDSGVQASHPFFSGRVVSEACFSHPGATGPACGTSMPIRLTRTGMGAGAPCQSPSACLSGNHGTHVAGISSGANGDGGSLSGVAPASSVTAIAAINIVNNGTLGCAPDFTCEVVTNMVMLSALDFIQRQRVAQNTRVVNISLGMTYGLSAVPKGCESDPAYIALGAVNIHNAFLGLRRNGVSIVTSAGNSGTLSTAPGFGMPTCLSSAVTVGNIDTSGMIENRSQTDSTNGVDIYAPGASVRSSVVGGGYDSAGGTSQAAPHISGALALLSEEYPDCDPVALLDTLQSTGETIFDSRVGSGGLDIPRLYLGGGLSAICRPAAPTNLEIDQQPTKDSISLVWRDLSFGEDEFQVEISNSSGILWIYSFPPNTNPDPMRDSTYGTIDRFLSGGTDYTAQVRACKSTFCSDWSNTISIRTSSLDLPPPVEGLRLLDATPTRLRIAWDSDSTGLATFYKVVWGGSLTAVDVPLSETSFEVSGLASNETYTFYVRGCNDDGCGNFEWISARTEGSSSPPVNLRIIAEDDTTVTLGWDVLTSPSLPPYDYYILEYTLPSTSGVFWTSQVVDGGPGFSRSYVFTKPVPAPSYHFRSKRCNSSSVPECSAPSNIVP